MPSAIPQPAVIARPGESSLYDPIVLYGETTLSSGSSLAPNTAALQNPHSLPMELLGVRFHLHALNTDNDASGGFVIPGSVNGLGVGVKMDMGKIQIVDAGVPVSLLGTARDDSEDGDAGYPTFSTNAYVATVAANAFLDASTSPLANTYDYFWKFAKPMLVPAKATVVPLFSHLTQTPWDVKIGVSYYCRTLRRSANTPPVVYVPWVTKYVSKSFDVNEGANVADSDASSEQDIYNPFPGACVELQRLSGRVNYAFNGAANAVTNGNYEYTTQAASMGDQVYEYMRMSMRSSRGDEIIQTPTRFGLLFQQTVKTWEFPRGWSMQPQEYYKIFLARDAFTGPGQVSGTGRIQFAVGAIGFRKINTSSLEGAL